MNVYKINSIQFTSKPTKKISINNSKKDFYNHINEFLNHNYTKEQYLKLFSKDIKAISKKTVTAEERKYIDDLLTTLDLAGKTNSISDKYIIDNMKKLMDAKK